MKRTMLAIFTLVMMTTLATAANTKLLSIDMNITKNDEPVSLQMNLPLSLVSSMVPQINEALEDVHFEENEFDLREIWAQVRDAGPNEYVNIEHGEGHVVVFTTETHVKIDITEEEQAEIHITVPLALGDLLFGEEELTTAEDVIAALENWEGDLVTITGDKINGRVWIQ